MALDPRIVLGLQTPDISALQQGAQGALQTAGQVQQLQQSAASMEQFRRQQQDIAEAREFQTNIRPFISTDPVKALTNVQNSSVLDDDDKQQIITAINASAQGNNAPLQALDGIVNSTLGVSGPEQFTLSPGQTRFAGSTPIAFGGAKPEELSGVQKKVAAEGIDPFSPRGRSRARELNQRAATNPALRSDLEVLNKANKDQLTAAGFANRVQASNNELANLEDTPGFDPASASAVVLKSIPGGNIALSEEQQLYQRAKADFITAVLRLESGAAIGVDEFEKEDKKFFPQPGDKPRVIEAKKKARERAFDNLRKQSKGVYDIQFGIPEGLPSGTINNGDGTFTLPTGERVEPE